MALPRRPLLTVRVGLLVLGGIGLTVGTMFLAKKAKDTASAAVFSGAILWAGLWVFFALG